MLPVLQAQGEPFASGSIVAQHAVMGAAHAEGIKVLLDGQGADELLGGYDLYLGTRAAGLARAGHPVSAARELRAQVARGPSTAGSAMATALHAALPRGAVEAIRGATGGRYGIQCAGPLADETARTEDGVTAAARSSPADSGRSSPPTGSPPCSATRTATAWRSGSRLACRSSTCA